MWFTKVGPRETRMREMRKKKFVTSLVKNSPPTG